MVMVLDNDRVPGMAKGENTLSAPTNGSARGFKFERRYSTEGQDPFSEYGWEQRPFNVIDPTTREVVGVRMYEMPDHWGNLSLECAVDKYAKTADVPGIGAEKSVKQIIERVARTYADKGLEQDYFESSEEAEIFHDELVHISLQQKAAFNSPVWFNVGLGYVYEMKGKPRNWAWDSEKEVAVQVEDNYQYPQVAACFIVSTADDLEVILGHVAKEGRVFENGSGAGTNYSVIRADGELIRGGGVASGLRPWLEIYDAAAGAIKSGGKTRRAAKMTCVDIDHPDVEEIIDWKKRQEMIGYALSTFGLSSSFEGEIYQDILKGQNGNISIRLSDEFMEAVENDEQWGLTLRTTGEVFKTVNARDLFAKINEASHFCADPGVQFDTTINEWNTCPNSGRIEASNPCSEYMFLNDSSCNLASLSLIKYRIEDGFDVDSFTRDAELMLRAQDISIDFASYPTKEIAENSHRFRPLGLGYSALGELLISLGLPYDSDEGRAVAATITALMTGTAYAQSAKMAEQLGAFDEFEKNRDPMLAVMEKHRSALLNIDREILPNGLENLLDEAEKAWDEALALGQQFGYRNAQTTLLAPCGTISTWMDHTTTGIEPGFSLITTKNLSGGGTVEIPLQSVELGLENLGYTPEQIEDICNYILEKTPEGAFLHPHMVGAPHIKPEDLSVFDTAGGKRPISFEGHLKMMAAVQPFLSGAISKTINVPHDYKVEDFERIHKQAWKMGIKAVAAYRDGSKLAQPLVSQGEELTLEELTSMGHGEPPRLREGWTTKTKIAGRSLLLTINEYGNGVPCEVFYHMAKAGTNQNISLTKEGILVSKMLQAYGVQEFVNTFVGTLDTEITGFSTDPNIPQVGSILDYTARLLGAHYMPDNVDLMQVPLPEGELRRNVLQRRKAFEEMYRLFNQDLFSEDASLDLSDNGNGSNLRLKKAEDNSSTDLFEGLVPSGTTCSKGHQMYRIGGSAGCSRCLICHEESGACG